MHTWDTTTTQLCIIKMLLKLLFHILKETALATDPKLPPGFHLATLLPGF